MKLFGLIESLNIVGWYRPLHVPIPHPILFKKLEEYSSDLSIGLEPSCAEGSYMVPPLHFTSQKIYVNLFEYFKSKGNKIFFLESEDFLKEMAKVAQKRVDLEKKLIEGQGKISKEEKALRLQIDKLGIEAVYMDLVGKEEPIIQNISCHKPDLVFLGDAHAARFYMKRELLREKYGIKIEEYWRDFSVEQITSDDVMWAAGRSSEHLSMENCLEDKVEVGLEKVTSSDMICENPLSIHAKRLYRAVIEKRITDNNPDFIGTWNLDFEHRGLFEVFIENTVHLGNGVKEIAGRIEDCLGSATFSGKIDGNKIYFTKKYTEIFDQSAAKVEVIYKGVRKGKEYNGTYSVERCKDRGFKMNDFFFLRERFIKVKSKDILF